MLFYLVYTEKEANWTTLSPGYFLHHSTSSRLLCYVKTETSHVLAPPPQEIDSVFAEY